ncbi:hypothetical protein Tco_0044875 [Tanacetum coccineum]
MGTHDDETGSLRPKRSRQYETVEEVLLPQVHHEFLEWEGCNRDAKSRLELMKNYSLLWRGLELLTSMNQFIQNFAMSSRLGGRAHRGLRSDEHFNAQEYWLSISREENLSLSRSHASAIRNPILRVLHKMITYGLCQRTTRNGAGTQRESLCGQFIMKLARKAGVLSVETSFFFLSCEYDVVIFDFRLELVPLS